MPIEQDMNNGIQDVPVIGVPSEWHGECPRLPVIFALDNRQTNKGGVMNGWWVKNEICQTWLVLLSLAHCRRHDACPCGWRWIWKSNAFP
uniref:hypothetical protein n=1 Tax=Castellaniella defragrans TaxID=75697 RepID=UPI00333FDF02